MPKTKQVEYDTDDYASMDQRTHIYNRPGMYIGSDEQDKRRALHYNLKTGEFYEASTTLPMAVERCFIETSQNASDNCERSRKRDVKFPPVIIDVSNKKVIVENGGIPILIKKKFYEEKNQELWIPEMLFGEFRTGQNYGDDDDNTSGTNGIGAKAVNVFSKEFEIEVGSSSLKKLYYQVWRDNMFNKSKPELSKYKEKESFVRISYVLDFKRFKMKAYTEADLDRFAGIAAGISASAKVPIIFNGVKIDFSNFETFAKKIVKILGGEKVKTFFHTEESYHICYVDYTPNGVRTYAYTNGIENAEGGTHVNEAYNAIKKVLLKDINEKRQDAKPLNMRSLKTRISMIICYQCATPKFSGQEKHKLTSKVSKITIDPDKIKKMRTWDACKKLEADLSERDIEQIKAEADAEMNGKIDLSKHIPAKWAKTKSKKNSECVLCVCEGDSAGQYAKIVRTMTSEGPNYIGVLIGRGKWINPRRCSLKVFYKNKLVRLLRHVLGIKGDKSPKLEDLRYQRIYGLADADVDGEHINGLVYNVLYEIAPCLIEENCFYIYRTPLVKTWQKNKRAQTMKFFYSEGLYEEWFEQNQHAKGWVKKYYKGLGTSDTAETKENEVNPIQAKLRYDVDAKESLEIAFGPSKETRQKKREWILNFKPNEKLYNSKQLDFSDFVDKQLVKYAIESNDRALPHFTDGMKPSHRKILFTALKYWGRNIDKEKLLKVSQLAPLVSTTVVYNHGEESLYKTIGTLANIYVGSSSMNMLYPSGMFGTRSGGAKDMAAPRYIFTRPELWVNKVFRQEDDLILEYVEEEPEDTKNKKKLCEPKTYYPVIPYALVSNISGIGTGWSSDVPPYNPYDLAEAIVAYLEGEAIPMLIPWYRGFTGKVKLYPNGRTKKVDQAKQAEREAKEKVRQKKDDEKDDDVEDSEDDVEDSEDEIKETKLKKPTVKTPVCLTEGTFEILRDGRVKVTELPATMKIDYYKTWLSKQLEDGVFQDVDDLFGNNRVCCIITGVENPTLTSLNLVKSVKMSNMVFLKDGIPKKYVYVQDYLADWSDARLIVYERRKKKQLEKYLEELVELKLKHRFLKLVIEDKIPIKSLNEEKVLEKLIEYEIPVELYNKTLLKSINKDHIKKHEVSIQKKETEYESLKQTKTKTIFIRELEEFMDYWQKFSKSKEENKFWETEIGLANPQQKSVYV